MIHTENLDKLAPALAKAQGAIENAKKDSVNPHFKSKYADLASVWDACRKPLTDNGLSVIQSLGNDDGRVSCDTMLLHVSGQWVRSGFSMAPQQNTPQAFGSCATYLRRYSLQAVVGVAPDEDDGNQASNKGTTNYAQPTTPKIVSSAPSQPVLVQKALTDQTKPSASNAFGRGNATQLLQLSGYLKVKDRVNMLDAMCDQLAGKEFTQTNINAAFGVVSK
jgi:hypothetical protein